MPSAIYVQSREMATIRLFLTWLQTGFQLSQITDVFLPINQSKHPLICNVAFAVSPFHPISAFQAVLLLKIILLYRPTAIYRPEISCTTWSTRDARYEAEVAVSF